MSFRIDDFKAAIRPGLARSNRYLVEFDSASRDQSEKLNLLCDAVTWPGRGLLTSERYTNMRNSRSAYAFNVEDVNLSFILTNDWETWDFLEQWQGSSIQNIESLNGYIVNLKRDYVRDVVIRHLDSSKELDKTVKSIRLINAFPTALNSMELGNANENEVMRCSATLAYDNWEIL